MARTDWQMGDTVEPADMNQIGQEINDAAAAAAVAQNDINAHMASTQPHTNLLGVEDFGFKAPTILTISNGAITPTQSFHYIDTEGEASTDELDTINGGGIGSILLLAQTASNRNITVRHGIGNIRVLGGTDIEFGGNTGTTGVMMFVKYNSQVWYAVGIQGVKPSGDTMTGDLYFDGVDRAIRNRRNDRLFFIAGGQGQNVANGSYIRLEGVDHGGPGVGGNLHLRTPPGKKATVNLNEIWDAGNMPYEEGVWTPIIQGSTTPGIHTYTVQSASYVRLGKLVVANFRALIHTKDNNMAGNVLVAGLPFVNVSSEGNRAALGMSYNAHITLSPDFTQLTGFVVPGANYIGIYQFGSGKGLSVLGSSGIADGSQLAGTVIYRTN